MIVSMRTTRKFSRRNYLALAALSAAGVLIMTGPQVHAGQIWMDGGVITNPSYGDTYSTTGNNAHAADLMGKAHIIGASGWSFSTTGHASHGIYAVDAYFSGTDVTITTTGNGSCGVEVYYGIAEVDLTSSSITTSGDDAHGLFIWRNGTIKAASSTITTSGNNSHGLKAQGGFLFGDDLQVNSGAAGLFVEQNGSISVKDSNFDVAGPLVLVGLDGANSVTLDNVTASIGGGNLFQNSANSSGGTTTLTLQNSDLAGNLSFVNGTTNGNSRGNVDLVNTTLTGMSQSKANHGLAMSIDSDSRWNVAGASTLNSMLNNGMLDLSGPASSLMVIKNANGTGGDFAQSSSGSLMLALNDMSYAAVTTTGSVSLSGGLYIILDDPLDGDFYVLFENLGYDPSGDFDLGSFDSITLNGYDIALATDGSGEFTAGDITGTFSYNGSAANGSLTGGYDLVMQITGSGGDGPAVPEPASLSLLGLGAAALISRRRK